MQGSQSHNQKLKCDFCERSGHTSDKCFLNPENPNNRLAPALEKALSSKSPNASKKSGATSSGSQSGKEDKSKFEFVGSIMESTTVDPPSDARTYADSGTTVHCFHSIHSFVPDSLMHCARRTVTLANNSEVETETSGEVHIEFDHSIIKLSNVLLIPTLGYNLVSTGKLADNGIESHFRRHNMLLKLEDSSDIIGCGSRDHSSGLYVLPGSIQYSESTL